MNENALLILNGVLTVFYALFTSPFFLGVLLILVSIGICAFVGSIIKLFSKKGGN